MMMTIQKMGSLSLFLSYKRLKLKLRVFLADHIVAMVTYCAAKLTATCSPMIGQFFDTMILASTDTESGKILKTVSSHLNRLKKIITGRGDVFSQDHIISWYPVNSMQIQKLKLTFLLLT